MVSATALIDSLRTITESIHKNRKNLGDSDFWRMSMRNWNRRNTMMLCNFPACEDGELRMKFIQMASILGVDIQETVINIIYHQYYLPFPSSPLKHVIVRLNNKHLRNRILFAEKQSLKVAEYPFKVVLYKILQSKGPRWFAS